MTEINEFFSGLDPAISKATGGRRATVYFLVKINRIGHLAQEMWQLHTIKPHANPRVIIVPPLKKATGVNLGLLAAMTSGDIVQEMPGHIMKVIDRLELGTYSTAENDYVLESPISMYRATCELLLSGGKAAVFTPPQYMKDHAERCRRELGINDTPIVTIHIREPGYLAKQPDLIRHRYRDADPGSYVPAVKWLLDQGYAVVRIGDATMQPMDIDHPLFIDAPFRTDVPKWIEAILIPNSRFLIATSSGPSAIARAYNIPMLLTNFPPFFANPWGDQDIIVPKRIYNRRAKEYLDYETYVQDKNVSRLDADDFIYNGYNWSNNSADDILAATQEMHGCLLGIYSVNKLFKLRVEKIHRMVFEERLEEIQNDPKALYFAPFLSRSRPSQEFAQRHAGYLDF